MIRQPIVAGQFYEEDPEALAEQIKSSFLNKLGPKELPGQPTNEKIKGIISAHAGYIFSGPAMAFGYKALAESYMPDTFLILGTCHTGYGTGVSKMDFQTPLGVVKNDKELTNLMVKNGIMHNEQTNEREHSIEVQLPFLQFIAGLRKHKVTFVPLVVASNDFIDVGHRIKNALNDYKKEIGIITSSDFTHYGYNYRYSPFKQNVKENLYKLDNGAIKHIIEMNPRRFLEYCSDTGATICGQSGIALTLELLKRHKAQLLTYYTSADIMGDYSSAVGYASIVIK
jgi:AmmeMemoRadiSam system protein B